MTSDLSSLDEIFSVARAHAINEKIAKKHAAERKSIDKPPEQSTKALYLDPKNWTRTRGVALIHEDSQALLGNFSEYLHNSVANCRKLVREETPIAVSATETVSGSWWLETKRKPEPRQEWHEKRTVIVHAHLSALFLHSPICELIVHLSYGSIARIELALDTQFAAEEEHGEQLVFFPAGTDILGVLSLDCKLAIRKDLGI